jgi:hypothetical protein
VVVEVEVVAAETVVAADVVVAVVAAAVGVVAVVAGTEATKNLIKALFLFPQHSKGVKNLEATN